jgi:hypothetical protein
MDPFIRLKGDLVVPTSAVARGNHEMPFDLRGLDKGGSLKELNGLLVDLTFDVVAAKPTNHIQVGWEVPE